MRWLVCVSLVLCPACSAQDVPAGVRTYDCLKLDSPPLIDGDPSEWTRRLGAEADDETTDETTEVGRAPWTELFVDILGDRRPMPRLRTRAAMAWDDAFFYIAAEMQEPHLWATLRAHDSVLHRQNNFEVFIDPDGDGAMYHELQINALNTVFDLLLVRSYRNGGPARHGWGFEGLVHAVSVDGTINDPSDEDRGWTVEIAIPWTSLAQTAGTRCPPEPGDGWRVNFSRVRWTIEPDTPPVATPGEPPAGPSEPAGYRKVKDPESGRRLPEDNWVWSPQARIDMHEPQHWGVVRFVGPGVP